MLFCWDYDERGNVEHIAEHGPTTEDVEHAFENVTDYVTSRSSGRPALYGLTPDERTIFVSYELDIEDDEEIVVVITAYPIGENS